MKAATKGWLASVLAVALVVGVACLVIALAGAPRWFVLGAGITLWLQLAAAERADNHE